MPTTSNFGWTTPADTDLVKDGAAAIRTLGNGIDTSLVDLKGGTTGQVLSKNSNTDLDYTWVTPNVGDITEVQAGTGISVASGTGPIPVVTNSMATEITAKGDLIVGTGSGTFDNLAVGTNGHALVADSATATGLKWASVSAASKNFTLLNSGGTALTGAQTVTVSGISNQDQLYVIVEGASSASASSTIGLRLNTDTGNNYNFFGSYMFAGATYDSGNFGGNFGQSNNFFRLARMSGAAGSSIWGGFFIQNANSTNHKLIISQGGGTPSGSNQQSGDGYMGYYTGNSAITSISIFSNTGNLDGGTVYVYGAA